MLTSRQNFDKACTLLCRALPAHPKLWQRNLPTAAPVWLHLWLPPPAPWLPVMAEVASLRSLEHHLSCILFCPAASQISYVRSFACQRCEDPLVTDLQQNWGHNWAIGFGHLKTFLIHQGSEGMHALRALTFKSLHFNFCSCLTPFHAENFRAISDAW